MNAINLLIVDDEERLLATHKKLLDKRGLNTATCTNGLDALKILKEQPIDVVLLDVKMPGMDGMEVLRRIKQDASGVEVILITGNLSVESEVAGLQEGAFGYLKKPVTITEIQKKVEEAFVHRQARSGNVRETALQATDSDRGLPRTEEGN